MSSTQAGMLGALGDRPTLGPVQFIGKRCDMCPRRSRDKHGPINPSSVKGDSKSSTQPGMLGTLRARPTMGFPYWEYSS